ncbi:MAG TPA: endonuclease [Candidatus Wallbacteria bacterium]|nr:endonuclease [Candidatus Wallbacteria bacterium]
MKKRVFLISLVFMCLITAISVFAQTAAIIDDDPAYGEKVKSRIVSEVMTTLDETQNSGGDMAEILALKKKVAELSALTTKNDTSRTAPGPNISKISAVYKDISGVLDAKAGSGSSDKLISIRAKIDSVAAGAGVFDCCNSLTNDALKQKLHELIKDHKQLGYDAMARKVMFGQLDNVNGSVRCVYTGRMVECSGVPSANPPQAMNTEHTWPKCFGAKEEPAKSDLNHLFPTDTFANSTRSDYPFGIVKRGSETWSQGGSSFDGEVFMPREDQRGRTARAIFYFSICYQLPIFGGMEPTLRQWHKDYPPNDEDRSRNERIYGFQGNRNPFIDRPDFVDKIDKF